MLFCLPSFHFPNRRRKGSKASETTTSPFGEISYPISSNTTPGALGGGAYAPSSALGHGVPGSGGGGASAVTLTSNTNANPTYGTNPNFGDNTKKSPSPPPPTQQLSQHLNHHIPQSQLQTDTMPRMQQQQDVETGTYYFMSNRYGPNGKPIIRRGAPRGPIIEDDFDTYMRGDSNSPPGLGGSNEGGGVVPKGGDGAGQGPNYDGGGGNEDRIEVEWVTPSGRGIGGGNPRQQSYQKRERAPERERDRDREEYMVWRSPNKQQQPQMQRRDRERNYDRAIAPQMQTTRREDYFYPQTQNQAQGHGRGSSPIPNRQQQTQRQHDRYVSPHTQPNQRQLHKQNSTLYYPYQQQYANQYQNQYQERGNSPPYGYSGGSGGGGSGGNGSGGHGSGGGVEKAAGGSGEYRTLPMTGSGSGSGSGGGKGRNGHGRQGSGNGSGGGERNTPNGKERAYEYDRDQQPTPDSFQKRPPRPHTQQPLPPIPVEAEDQVSPGFETYPTYGQYNARPTGGSGSGSGTRVGAGGSGSGERARDQLYQTQQPYRNQPSPPQVVPSPRLPDRERNHVRQADRMAGFDDPDIGGAAPLQPDVREWGGVVPTNISTALLHSVPSSSSHANTNLDPPPNTHLPSQLDSNLQEIGVENENVISPRAGQNYEIVHRRVVEDTPEKTVTISTWREQVAREAKPSMSVYYVGAADDTGIAEVDDMGEMDNVDMEVGMADASGEEVLGNVEEVQQVEVEEIRIEDDGRGVEEVRIIEVSPDNKASRAVVPGWNTNGGSNGLVRQGSASRQPQRTASGSSPTPSRIMEIGNRINGDRSATPEPRNIMTRKLSNSRQHKPEEGKMPVLQGQGESSTQAWNRPLGPARATSPTREQYLGIPRSPPRPAPTGQNLGGEVRFGDPDPPLHSSTPPANGGARLGTTTPPRSSTPNRIQRASAPLFRETPSGSTISSIGSSPQGSLERFLDSCEPSLVHTIPILAKMGITSEQHLRAIKRLTEEIRNKQVKEEALRLGMTIMDWAILLDRLQIL